MSQHVKNGGRGGARSFCPCCRHGSAFPVGTRAGPVLAFEPRQRRLRRPCRRSVPQVMEGEPPEPVHMERGPPGRCASQDRIHEIKNRLQSRMSSSEPTRRPLLKDSERILHVMPCG